MIIICVLLFMCVILDECAVRRWGGEGSYIYIYVFVMLVRDVSFVTKFQQVAHWDHLVYNDNMVIVILVWNCF